MTIQSGHARQKENGIYGNHRHATTKRTRYISVQCPHCGFNIFSFTGNTKDGVCANLGKGCGQEVKADAWIIVSDMTF